MTKFWAFLGKLGAVIAILVGGINLYDFFYKHEADVSVAVSHELFAWPKTIENQNSNFLSDAELAVLSKVGKQLDIKSSWFLGIHNNGKKEAVKLKLKLPYAYSYQLARDGYDLVVERYNNVISISDIQPNESIYVIAWSTTDLTDEHMKSIILTHSEGVADIHAYVQIESVWKDIRDNLPDVVIYLCLLGIAILGYILWNDNYHSK